MASAVVNSVVPLVSVLIGALLTYWINVRARRTHRLEDLFDEAIGAVAVAQASTRYVRDIGRPENMPVEVHDAMSVDLVRSGLENYVKRVGEAREAIARVAHHDQRLRPYFQDEIDLLDCSQEAIDLLQQVKDATLSTRNRRHSALAGLGR